MNKAAQQLHNATTTQVMGVLNITEDSFSDGGLWLEESAAAQHGRDMADQGADIIDIGAESTRPGAVRVDEETERERIISAVRNLSSLKVPLSIDTTRASVAAASLAEGAMIINDVSGGQLDADLAPLVAEHGCLYIVQHWRGWLKGGKGKSEKKTSKYANGVVADVYDELLRQVESVEKAGVRSEQIIIDPGLGFSKPGVELNLPLLQQLNKFEASGYPVLVGASRKRFVASMIDEEESNERKDTATAVLSAFAALQGAWGVRVHNVTATRDALAVASAWEQTHSVAGARHAGSHAA